MGRDKEGIDGAMSGFMAMLEDDKDNVPALLGMSLAFTLENSPNKVRGTGRPAGGTSQSPHSRALGGLFRSRISDVRLQYPVRCFYTWASAHEKAGIETVYY